MPRGMPSTVWDPCAAVSASGGTRRLRFPRPEYLHPRQTLIVHGWWSTGLLRLSLGIRPSAHREFVPTNTWSLGPQEVLPERPGIFVIRSGCSCSACLVRPESCRISRSLVGAFSTLPSGSRSLSLGLRPRGDGIWYPSWQSTPGPRPVTLAWSLPPATSASGWDHPPRESQPSGPRDRGSVTDSELTSEFSLTQPSLPRQTSPSRPPLVETESNVSELRLSLGYPHAPAGGLFQ